MCQSAPLLESAFRFEAPALLVPRVRLYESYVELTGWRLFGRYRRRVPLGRLLHADAGARRLVLWLDSGEALRLQVPEAQQWKEAIEARQVCGHRI